LAVILKPDRVSPPAEVHAVPSSVVFDLVLACAGVDLVSADAEIEE
jgi:hypothetical protein